MLPRLAPLLLAASAAAAQPPAPLVGDAPVVDGTLGRRLDEHLARLAPFGFTGTALVVRGGRPVLAKGYGLADRARGAPMTARTIVPVGSIVKSFTGAAILALEADGRLRTTDSLGRFFPDLPADKRAITLRQLMTHAAGLPLYAADGDDAPLSHDAFMAAWRTAPLAFPPGTARAYSNVGYGVLAAIVEDVAGQDLEAFVRERLLLPAGMRETGWHYPAWDTTRLAHAYQNGRDAGTQLRLPHAEGARATWAVHGAGGWLSTAEDLYRWHVALSGDRLLPAEQRTKLRGGAGPGAGPGASPTPSPLGPRVGLVAGGNGVFETVLVEYADAETAVIVANTTGGQLAVPTALDLDRLASGGAPAAAAPAVVALPAAALARHAGTYALRAGGTIAVTVVDGGLALAPEGQAAYDALFGGGTAGPGGAPPGAIGGPGGAGTRGPSRGPSREGLVARTDSVVRASVAGDWAPFRAALSLDAPADAVARREEGARTRLAAELGAAAGWRVVGTIAFPDGADVVVRFDHARGAYFERYGWRGGVVALFLRGGAGPSLTLLPTGADAFAWYDVARGRLVAGRFEGDRLRLETPAGAVDAVRAAAR